eukprot:GHVR01175928.1.p2 GENE.GHVR01175928.1~~GHVR01175928.1.p2  ORF type:complete len:139 (-),score=19.09 GHVR01175928.1:36-452(-)
MAGTHTKQKSEQKPIYQQKKKMQMAAAIQRTNKNKGNNTAPRTAPETVMPILDNNENPAAPTLWSTATMPPEATAPIPEYIASAAIIAAALLPAIMPLAVNPIEEMKAVTAGTAASAPITAPTVAAMIKTVIMPSIIF